MFAPLGTSILEPDLHTGFAQIQLDGQLLACKHIRIGCALEGAFQFLQLICREGGSVRKREELRQRNSRIARE